MSKQFTAHVPAIGTFRAHDVICEQDDTGHWTMDVGGYGADSALESDVIDKCRKATNWAHIKSEHFQMDGFFAGGEIVDRTPAYKHGY